MEFTVQRPCKINVTHVRIDVPVNYGTEDIPADFPHRDGDSWKVEVEIDTGQINNWPICEPCKIEMKVVDEGIYTLLGSDGAICEIIDDYVPHCLIPGEYGDYIVLEIDENGVITNWVENLDVAGISELLGR
jgi:hypothetical protein